ncbi:phosphatidylserine/phosphatidylglycerophosphate/cardiolipin synthase family protein [Mesorhizobium sp. IMUNJ 23033]|uniref:phosphatidylserine/phosphatidylglycerophosphate/ cardiolipin synthase family protein n=1 Tax=Mesorhizobium sp. IMUNJ 23033 TaxID=3378039 RepID=UPI00384D3B26
MPPKIESYSSDKEVWLAKAVALVEAVGNLPENVKIAEVAVNYRDYAHIYGPSIWGILQRSLARAELAAPASSAGAFLPVGSAMDAMTAIGKVLKEARSNVLIVDPYMDHIILTDFAPMISEGIKIELLSDTAHLQATLAPAVIRWASKYGLTRPIEARKTGPRALHDRLIVVDGSKVWRVSQSFKDLAGRSPAMIALVPADVAALKIPAYADIWTAATSL